MLNELFHEISNLARHPLTWLPKPSPWTRSRTITWNWCKCWMVCIGHTQGLVRTNTTNTLWERHPIGSFITKVNTPFRECDVLVLRKYNSDVIYIQNSLTYASSQKTIMMMVKNGLNIKLFLTKVSLSGWAHQTMMQCVVVAVTTTLIKIFLHSSSAIVVKHSNIHASGRHRKLALCAPQWINFRSYRRYLSRSPSR